MQPRNENETSTAHHKGRISEIPDSGGPGTPQLGGDTARPGQDTVGGGVSPARSLACSTSPNATTGPAPATPAPWWSGSSLPAPAATCSISTAGPALPPGCSRRPAAGGLSADGREDREGGLDHLPEPGTGRAQRGQLIPGCRRFIRHKPPLITASGP